MAKNPEVTLCLTLDEHGGTLTTFDNQPDDVPEEIQPDIEDYLNDCATAEVYINPEQGANVIRDINKAWSTGQDASYKQFLPGDKFEEGLIRGYSVVNAQEPDGLMHIRIYTPK